ncbi:MAG TPA: pilus assembly protein [Burkholderiaceae bacterium]|nr:pilus assembly protein [Burkholderiaceae bacterium]
MHAIRHPAAHRQHGVTLVIVLMLLVVVTLLGVGAARMALLGERSARNDRDYQVAWQAAEAALMDAQFDIRGPNASGSQRMALFNENNTSVFQPGCNTTPPYLGLCQPAVEGAKPVWATVDFTDDSGTTVAYGTYTGRTFDAGGTGVRPARAPRYMIEWVPDTTPGGSAASGSKPIMYRVTAMGFGTREDVQVVMQMAFKKE